MTTKKSPFDPLALMHSLPEEMRTPELKKIIEGAYLFGYIDALAAAAEQMGRGAALERFAADELASIIRRQAN